MMIWYKLWVEASWIGYHTTIYIGAQLCLAVGYLQIPIVDENAPEIDLAKCSFRGYCPLGVLGISIILRQTPQIEGPRHTHQNCLP